MKKTLLVGIITCTFQSCVSVQQIPLKVREFNSVIFNKELSSDIGDVLIQKGIAEYRDAVQIIDHSNDFSFNLGVIKYPYKIGDILPFSYSTNMWDLYDGSKTFRSDDLYSFGVAVNKSDRTIIRAYAYRSGGELIIRKSKIFSIKYTTFYKDCSECFKQEFIFKGKVGTNLKFSYREFISDFARPAFNEDLQYDLNESNVIGYKGLKIEIIKSTNTYIAYRVISTFQNR